MKLTPLISTVAFALAVPAAGHPGKAAPVQAAVPIQLYSFGYTPNPIVLRAGQPVTLMLTNISNAGHTFKSQAFFASSRIEAGAVHDGEVHVMPHQSVSVTLVPARGVYPVHCSHFFHDQMGMHTTIYVQ
jgi:plastocyanin